MSDLIKFRRNRFRQGALRIEQFDRNPTQKVLTHGATQKTIGVGFDQDPTEMVFMRIGDHTEPKVGLEVGSGAVQFEHVNPTQTVACEWSAISVGSKVGFDTNPCWCFYSAWCSNCSG